MYEVWCTQGQGVMKVAEFPTFQEALKYILPKFGVDGSFGIKRPDGEWAMLEEFIGPLGGDTNE